MRRVQNTKRRSAWPACSFGGGQVAPSPAGLCGQVLRVMDMEYSMPIPDACGTSRCAGGGEPLGVGCSGALNLWAWTLEGT